MKIGDKVKVIGYSNWNGETVEITDIIDKELYPYVCIDSEGLRCIFKKEDLKLIKTNMKKSDLKDGMICKLRHEGVCVLKEGVFMQGNIRISSIKNYNHNLKNIYIGNNRYDIVEIYESIWQREEPTELTMQEIADKFNIEVTNLKIKK